MKIRILIALLLFVSILTLAYGLPSAEARPFSNFKWNIDETYHRDGHVQFVVQKSSENFLPIEVKGLNNVTVTLHPTINHDQTGEAKLPRGVDIYFEPDMVTLTYGEIKTVKLVINVDENAPANLYDVQIVGTWKEENNSSGFMGSAIRLHVGHDFGDGKIPVNMLDPPLKFWKYIKNEEGITVNDVPCRNDYVLIVKHDGSPACVTESTKQKLVDRGWIKMEIKDSNNPLLQKWTYDTKGEISSIDISKDDSIIAVGTAIRDIQKGMLYLLDNDGMLLWEEEFDSMISHVDISNNTILVNGFHICGGGGGARTHCNYTADIFDIQGNEKQSYAHDDNTSFGASLSPNGSQIITHTYDVLEYFNIQENDSWMYDPDESIRHATFLTDSILLVNTDNTGEIIALDNTGDKLWNFTTNYPDNYSYATSSNGKYFVVSDDTSPDDGNIYLLDSNGNLLWQANTGNTVLHLEFSGDDSRILAELNDAFMVYDMRGNLLWKNNIPSNLTMSSYGSFLLGTTFNQGSGASITLFDGKGNILSNYPTDKESLGAVFALANSDEYFVMANDTNQLIMFEVIPDFDKVYYDLTDIRDSEDLHVKIVPKTPGLFEVAIAKGDSVEIPWDIKFEQGYARSNFDVSIASDSDIESQITPTSPYTPINGVPPGEKIIIIHPKPDATTENYAVQILGRGDTVHNQTGWMTNLDGKILGTINVNVIPKPLGLQRVLDSCHSTGIQPSMGYRYSNDTHTIANNSCEWQTIEEYENEN